MLVTLQPFLPTRLLSRGWLYFSRIRVRWLARASIRFFQHRFRIDLSDARKTELTDYPDLNAFFTRALREDARPLPDNSLDIACPVDGTVSQVGLLRRGAILQAKGKYYDAGTLLGDNPSWAERFRNGHFCTLYLAPHNYHRVHMPNTARLVHMHHVPGRLFSVNPASVMHLEGLFTRNERVITLWQTDSGPMALVLVGAMLVGCVETVWSGRVMPETMRVLRSVQGRESRSATVQLRRGEEMGRFNMGSTVILLYGPEMVRWLDTLTPRQSVLQGQSLGTRA